MNLAVMRYILPWTAKHHVSYSRSSKSLQSGVVLQVKQRIGLFRGSRV